MNQPPASTAGCWTAIKKIKKKSTSLTILRKQFGKQSKGHHPARPGPLWETKTNLRQALIKATAIPNFPAGSPHPTDGIAFAVKRGCGPLATLRTNAEGNQRGGCVRSG
jgi:hypothetical protein